MGAKMGKQCRGALLALLVLTFAGVGCIGTTAAKSVNGKAFVVQGSVFGTSVYNCDASGERPVCYEVSEEPLK